MKKILMDEFARKVKVLGCEVETFEADRTVYKISKKDKSFITIGKHFPLNSIVAYNIAKRKDLTKQILENVGISTPRGILTSNWELVKKTIDDGRLNFPLVAKPDTSSLGKSVVADIRDVEGLKLAFDNVKEKFEQVLIEEYFDGEDYRFLVLDGRVLTVAHRVLPYVTGNGKTPIRDLSKIEINREVVRTLDIQGYVPETVPSVNEKVVLRKNANVHTGATVENVSGKVGEYYNEIAVKAAEAIGLRFSGVDILAQNIEDEKSGYVVTEVNADPSYDIHFSPAKGEQYDPTEEIVKALLD